MTDQPDDPRRRAKKPAAEAPAAGAATGPGPEGYPPPMFAPAAEPGPESYPPPTFAPAAEPAPAAAPAIPEPAAPAPASGATAAAAPTEEPLLPATYRENDLRTAIGSPPMPEHIRPRRARADEDDDDGEGAPRRRKTALVIAGTLVVGLGIAALVVFGRLNSARYAVSCGAKQAAAEQGRAFPPWGMRRLGGDAWRPIPIPPSFPCAGLTTEDPAELGEAYRKILVERAESLLTAKEVTQIDEAAAMLEQALLHARGDSEPDKAARQAIQRMLGDVGYWRASARLQQAAGELGEAAKQFETAAGQRPRYVTDASAWAAHVRRLAEELRGGPAGAKAPASAPAGEAAPPAPDRPPAPAGVALPVEPDAGSGSASGAGSAEPPPATPDAGIPTGGVLL